MSPSRRSSSLLASVVLATVGGCLVVTPLDELPQNSSSSGGASSGRGGNASAGSSVLPEGGVGAEPAGGQPASGAGGCKSNAECVAENADEPAICRQRDHACVPLTTPKCPLAYGDAADPNAIVFGAFATLSPVAPEDSSIVWAHRLALGELSGDSVGGLPNGPNGKRRPLVMVVCDNTGDIVGPGLDHLIKEVEVPAIIGTLKPGDLRRAYEDYGEHDVFFMSPVSVTKTVAAGSDQDHIWNLLGQPSDFAPTYAALLTLAEAHVRALQTEPQRQVPLRVALVTTSDAFDAELAAAVAPLLRFNGKSVTDNGSDFTSTNLDDKPNLAQSADEIAAWGPDIVISTASEAFVMTNGVQQFIDDDWVGTAPKDKPLPFYILSPYNAGNLSALVKRVSARIDGEPNVDHQQRFVGVSIASAPDNTLQNAYAIRLRSRFKNAITDTANYYDATYYLAYAMYAADQPNGLTGSGIARGMKRLLSGDSFDVGPSSITDVFVALTEGEGSVHVRSTLGPPDFDAKTGVRAVDGSVFCFDRVGNTARVVPDALRYDRNAKALVGKSFPCISGFFVP